MRPIRSPETSVRKQPTPRNNPEHDIIQVNRSGSLRCRIFKSFYTWNVSKRTDGQTNIFCQWCINCKYVLHLAHKYYIRRKMRKLQSETKHNRLTSEMARCWVNDRRDAWDGARYESLRISWRVPIPGSVYIGRSQQNAALQPSQCGLRTNFRSMKQTVWNAMNNYFIRIHAKILFKNTLQHWQHKMLSTPNINRSHISHRATMALLVFVANRFSNRKVAWWLLVIKGKYFPQLSDNWMCGIVS